MQKSSTQFMNKEFPMAKAVHDEMPGVLVLVLFKLVDNLSTRRPWLLLIYPMLSLFMILLLISIMHTIILLMHLGLHFVLPQIVPVALLVLSFGVMFLNNPMHSLLCLISLFLLTVVLFLSLGAEYLGFVFLIVYAGAVAILFLFVMMLLPINEIAKKAERSMYTSSQLFSLSVGFLLANQLYGQLSSAFADLLRYEYKPLSSSTMERAINAKTYDVSQFYSLYTDANVLFGLITGILLVSLLGAIMLATASTEGPLGTKNF